MATGLLGLWNTLAPSSQKRLPVLSPRSRPHLIERQHPDEELAEIALVAFAFHRQHQKHAHPPAGSSPWSRAGRSSQMEPFVRPFFR